MDAIPLKGKCSSDLFRLFWTSSWFGIHKLFSNSTFLGAWIIEFANDWVKRKIIHGHIPINVYHSFYSFQVRFLQDLDDFSHKNYNLIQFLGWGSTYLSTKQSSFWQKVLWANTKKWWFEPLQGTIDALLRSSSVLYRKMDQKSNRPNIQDMWSEWAKLEYVSK